MKNEPDEIEILSGDEMRSDTKAGNKAQRHRLKAAAIKRMDRAEHWILISFDADTPEGRPSSWIGLCSKAGTKLQTLKFFLEMLIEGSRMVGKVMARALFEAREKRQKGGGS